jgi:hypothetical protein
MTGIGMPEADLPEDWGDARPLHDALGDAMAEADCGWLLKASEAGFLLGCVIAAHEDVRYRMAIAGKLCELVMGMARTGTVPEGMLQ